MPKREMENLESAVRLRLAEAVMEAVHYPDAIELGRIPRPYSEAIKRIVHPFPVADLSEDQLGFVYLALVEASLDIGPLSGANWLLTSVEEAGSLAYVSLCISNAGPFAAMEYYKFHYDEETGWLVQRPKLPKDHPFQPNARRFRRWCQSNGITVLKPEHLDTPIAQLGPPVPPDAKGVVYHWLFGMGADEGPEYGHVAPISFATGCRPDVKEYLRQ